MATLHDGPNCDGELLAAGITEPKTFPGRNAASIVYDATGRANRAVRPKLAFKVFTGGVFISETDWNRHE